LLGGLLTVLVVVGTTPGCGGATDVDVDNGIAASDGGRDGSTFVCRPEECPGVDTECSQRTCIDNACAATLPPAGTRTKVQKAGDCKVDQCDGAGAVASVPDDTDKVIDPNPCTVAGCSAGVMTTTAAVKGVPCGTALACDGEGSCVGCTAPTDCPGVDTECQKRTCIAKKCGLSSTPVGTLVTSQAAGDCMKNQCDGAGNVQAVIDNSDVPNDGKTCTTDVCTAGVPSNPPLASGAACAQGNGAVCDGAGACVQCVTASTCPGADSTCRTRTCIANTCGVSFAALGTKTPAQTTGDCQVNQCDGAGNVVSAADNADVPVDGNVCTGDVCTAGVPSNPALAADTPCAVGNGTRCNGAGACVQCLVASTCAGADTACQTRTCIANACGFSFAAAGTVTPAQTAGDCKSSQCDGAGHITAVTDDSDVPVDANPCTDNVCTAGVPTNPFSAPGTSCNQGGTVCSGAGACVQCITASTCPGVDTECKARTCLGNVCGFSFAGAGTVTAAQVAGDCTSNQCDGAGNIVSVNLDADKPADDGNDCTDEVCAAGVASHPPLAMGIACASVAGGSCDGAGMCIAPPPPP
jgi:hypothetical protein